MRVDGVSISIGILAAAAILAWLGWRGGDGAESATQAWFPPATDRQITPIPATLPLDPRKVALGRRLFHDTRLSRDGTVACASCHDIGRAGVDGRPRAIGIDGRVGEVNSPTVFNSGFSFRQFWDGRAASLEAQVEGPVHNTLEMNSNWSEVIAKLARDEIYVEAFREIWPAGISAARIESAIAEFERALLTPDAPFDRYLEGEAGALSPLARQGWDRFRELGCIACHQGINVGGNMYANLGVMGDFFAERGKPLVKADLGRYNVSGREQDRHVFKVPSLRNVALTAPYFHDGSIATLDEAVETMARYQLGIRLPIGDRQALVAFLESLSGRQPDSAEMGPVR